MLGLGFFFFLFKRMSAHLLRELTGLQGLFCFKHKTSSPAPCSLPLPFLPHQPGESVQTQACGLVIRADVYVGRSSLWRPILPRSRTSCPRGLRGEEAGPASMWQMRSAGLCNSTCGWAVMTASGQQKENILWVLVHLAQFRVVLEMSKNMRIPLQTTRIQSQLTIWNSPAQHFSYRLRVWSFLLRKEGEQISVKGNIPVDRLKGNSWSEESISRAVETEEWLEVSLFREHGLLCPHYYNPSLEHHGHIFPARGHRGMIALLLSYNFISWVFGTQWMNGVPYGDVRNRRLFRLSKIVLAQEKFHRKGLGKVLWVLREMLDHFFRCLFGDYSLMSTHQAIG